MVAARPRLTIPAMRDEPRDDADRSATPGAGTVAPALPPGYRRVLLLALWINLLMFGLELAAALAAGSVSLLGDAIDFFGDAANYGLSLLVLGAPLVRRARVSLLKAACMAGFGVFVLWQAGEHLRAGVVPEARTMGAVAVLALFANFAVARMLYRFRHGDSERRAVWLVTRNDALANLLVLAAAVAVAWSGSGLPDVAAGVAIAVMALLSAREVARHAFAELRAGPGAGPPGA